MTWIFAAITVVATAAATFVNDLRRAIFSLWVAGLSIGALYLTLGAELLATVQWVVSTLVAISFIFFAIMFGEFSRKDSHLPWRKRLIPGLCALALGLCFAAVIGLGQHGILVTDASSATPPNLAVLGRELVDGHWLALEVLALTLLMTLVGGGVIARPEERPVRSAVPPGAPSMPDASQGGRSEGAGA